jgi:hypothetical protein
MTNRTNRRAEEFDRALRAEGGAKIDPTTASLVALAGALTAMPQKAAPAFKETLRAQLMSEAASIAASGVPAAAGAAAGGGHVGSLAKALSKPAMQVATGGLAATIAATGIGVGASRSVPGDTLYGLKRAIERLQDDLAGGTVDEAQSVLGHADTRVEEVLALLDAGGTIGQIESTLTDLKGDIDAAAADLLDQVRGGSREAYDTLTAKVDDLTKQLTGLREKLPVDAQDELDAAMATLNSTAALLRALPVPPLPGVTPPTSPSPTSVTPSSPRPTTVPPTTVPPTKPPVTVTPEPTITIPPLPTVEPTVSVTVPPLVP